jgi:type I restriction enzyme M protein
MLRNNMTELKNRIWQLFNLLRGDLHSEDYSLVLLLIYLRSENLISEKLNVNNGPKSSLVTIMKETEDVIVQKIYQSFLPIVEGLSKESIRLIIDLLNSVDSKLLKKNIAKIYDDTLEHIVLFQGRRSGILSQTNQLTEFINSYIGSTKNKRIFNPFSGVASMIKGFDQSKSIYAQEINQKTWAIGQLRLIISNSKAVYNCDDSIMNWPKKEKFDLIVSNPPLLLRLNGANRDKFPEYRNAVDFLLGMSVNSLSKNGQLVAVLPKGILFRGGREKRIREDLIQNDLIDTIISFPGGLLHHTSIPFVIVILNKAKKNSEKIKLVNAAPFVSKSSTRDINLDVESLLISVNDENPNAVRVISNQDVIKNNFNLNIARYFLEEIEGVKLLDLIKPERGIRVISEEMGRVIRIRDLKNDTNDFHLDVSEHEEIPLYRPGLNKIESSCILLASRWKTLKPTYFIFQGKPIYLATDVLAFHVNEAKVDINYLVNELHADYMQQQFESYNLGSNIPYIRSRDLLDIKIKLPSIEEQRAKVTGLKEISERIKQLRFERNALAHGVSKKEFDEFASLKHTLGRPRQNILGWSKNLSKFFVREKENLTALNDEFKALFDLGITEAINEINRDIKFISDVLEKGENGLVLKDHEKEIVPLVDVNNIINKYSNNEFKFSIKKQILDIDEIKNKGIYINKILFKTLIDNILTNASKYGFKDKSKGNHVIIDFSQNDDFLIVDIRNNGLPFPQNFDRQKFITKFNTADHSKGSGLGGYDINRIATYFENENWELELNNPIYPVIFRFSFSIKPVN